MPTTVAINAPLRGSSLDLIAFVTIRADGLYVAEILGSDELLGIVATGADAEAAVHQLCYMLEIIDAERYGGGLA